MKKLACTLQLAAMIAGCGADVATTAVTTGKLQAQAAEQAKAQEAQIKGQLEDAMKASNPSRVDEAGR